MKKMLLKEETKMNKEKTIEIKKGDVFKAAMEVAKNDEVIKGEPRMGLVVGVIASLIEKELFKED